MIFRFRYIVMGGHTHIRMFCGNEVTSLSKCGDLVFRNEEWQEFKLILQGNINFSFLEEEKKNGSTGSKE